MRLFPAFSSGWLAKPGPGVGFWAALALGFTLAAQEAPGIQGLLEVDPDSGAVTLLFPLGPGIGRPGLRYLPALVGRLAPQAGTAPGAFVLSPGSLDWSLAPDPPEVRWTYPAGTGGAAERTAPGGLDPVEVLARFGYAPPARPDHLPHAGSAPPAPLVLAGAAGERLFALAIADPVAPPPAREGSAPGPWVLPEGLLVVRGPLAYEFRRALAARSGAGPGTARYRLTAVRVPAGEPVRFAYGPNGLDFTATCGAAGVRAALDSVGPAQDFPASGAAPARLRITYEGPGAAAGYTVSLLLRAEELRDGPREGATDPAAIPPAFPNPLHVTRIRADVPGETVAFSYAPAPRPADVWGIPHDPPTVLQEIAFPPRNLRLDWEPWPDAQAQTGARRCPRPRVTYGVRAIREAGASTYRRAAPGLVPAPSWARQSRRFDFGASGDCATFVRDRWILQGSTGVPLQGRLSGDCEIPTCEWDPQEQMLVPVAGQWTLRMDW